MTDDLLLQGLRRRESAALSLLIDTYATPVYQLVHRILAGIGSEQDVEECTSDTFHAAWERVGQYDPSRAPLRTWLLILAKYQALERRRRLGRAMLEPLAPDCQTAAPDPTPEEALASAEERAAVQAALNQLPTLEKELLYRRYFIGERVEDLARELGLSRQAADNRLWRARKRLRELLYPHLQEVAGDEA